MFRPFRPTLETLEKREVFSAGPLAPVSPVEVASNDAAFVPGVLSLQDYVELHVVPNRVRASTSNGPIADGFRPVDAEVAVVSPRDTASGLPTGKAAYLLPYIEQDNLYKSSNSSSAFNPNPAQSQIIAVLTDIGLVPHAPSNDLLAGTYGRGVIGDWDGDGIDEIGMVVRRTAAAHDAVFAEIGSTHLLSVPRTQSTGVAVDPTNPNIIY